MSPSRTDPEPDVPSGSSSEGDDNPVTQKKLRRDIRDTTSFQASGIRKEFEQQHKWTDGQFSALNARIEKVDGRLTDMDAGFKTRFDILDSRLANARAIRHWNHIRTVPRWDESLGYSVLPPTLPMRVGIFWQLKLRQNWSALVQLHEFYGTESWTEWGHLPYDDDSDEDEPQPTVTHETLQEAVEYAPEIALQELAIHLGLDYDKIEMSIRDARKHRRVRTDPIKRSAPTETATNAPKRVRQVEAPTNPGRSDEQQVRVEAPRLPLRYLLGNDYQSSQSSKTPSPRVEWRAPTPSPVRRCVSLSPTEIVTPTSAGGD